MALLSIIVVSYNTREMTLECLRSVFNETHSENFEIIVFDNASSDGSADAISEAFGEKVRLIRSCQNLGFAAGNNRAIELAFGDIFLLLNPDTIVLNGGIDRLLEFSNEKPDAGIWGGRTLFADGSLNPASCWSRQTLWSLCCQALGLNSLFRRSSLFNSEGMGGWNRQGVRNVDIVSGCFLLIGRPLWLELGGFREEFFMYGEEADLCLRARECGANPIVSSVATIVHYGGASETVRSDKLVRLLAAKMLLIKNFFPAYSRGLGRLLLGLWPLTRYYAHVVLARLGRSKSKPLSELWLDVLLKKEHWL